MNDAMALPPNRSTRFVLALSFVLGLVFGMLAMLNQVYMPVHEEASTAAWLLNHLTSGTWLWAVAASALTLVFMQRDVTVGWRRYVKAVAISDLFLTATTITWYGFVIPTNQVPLLVLAAPLVCLIPSSGIGFLGAYYNAPGLLALVAQLCLPLGLTTVLLFTTPPPISYGGDAYASHLVWWSLMAVHAVMALAFLLRYLLVSRRHTH